MKAKPKTTRLGGAHAENPFQKARIKAGISQEKAADRLPCGLRTLQRYEAGETKPDNPTRRRMMDCYKCEAADLSPDLSLLDGEIGGGAE
ncbi:MAG: helix-turn-helix transcriptional regulator [Oscillospiraceae bacterium]|nr:helix-turn-helix transcriptional regulator [Oscillospiraceae bacterium]